MSNFTSCENENELQNEVQQFQRWFSHPHCGHLLLHTIYRGGFSPLSGPARTWVQINDSVTTKHQGEIGTALGWNQDVGRVRCSVMPNNFMHFDTLTKHRPVNKEKYAALCILIRESENSFQDWWKHLGFLCICNSFSVNINTFCANSEMKRIVTIGYSTKKLDRVSLPDFHKTYLTREKHPLIQSRILLISLLLALPTFMNNHFQGWSTGRGKFHQNSLRSTLRIHSELHLLLLNQTLTR